MPITNPSQLVDEYKKLGEFDRLRRELLAQFQEGEHYGTFIARIEEIIKERLAVDSKLQYMPEAVACRELAEEVDRYPVVERAVADLPRMSDSQLASTIHRKLSSIVDEDRYSTLSRTHRGRAGYVPVRREPQSRAESSGRPEQGGPYSQRSVPHEMNSPTDSHPLRLQQTLERQDRILAQREGIASATYDTDGHGDSQLLSSDQEVQDMDVDNDSNDADDGDHSRFDAANTPS